MSDEILQLTDLKELEAMKPEVAEEIDTYRLSFELSGGKGEGFDQITIYDCNDDGCYATHFTRLYGHLYGTNNFTERERTRLAKTIVFAINSIKLHGSFDNEHVRWLIESGEKYK